MTKKDDNNEMKTESKTNGCEGIVKGSFEQPTYTSSELIGNNEDLLRQILINIPEKPLSRFKIVSKIWLHVISNPEFSLWWNRKHIPLPSALFFSPATYRWLFIPFDGQDKFSQLPFSISHDIQIEKSCNGLVLLKDWWRYWVFNPTTKQSKLIPAPTQGYKNLKPINLAFDPLKSHHFKLVSSPCSYGVLVYSSETDSWRVLSEKSVHTSNTSLCNSRCDDLIYEVGVFTNGAIHWPCHRGRTSLCFDVDEERFRIMPMPPIQGGEQWRTIRYFGESQRRLHMIEYEDDLTVRFDVFEMETDYSNWFVKYNVNLTLLGWRINSVGCLIQRFDFLSFVVVNGREDSAVLVMYLPDLDLVISYNLKNQRLKKLCRLPYKVNYPYSNPTLLNVHQFIKPFEF
ncbi:hypothetical protein LguiB_005661 [Lonicera macranthoides]